jgi:hypothetical protein
MKTPAVLAVLALASSWANASLYEYPERKRPSISLSEAVSLTEAMLKARGESKKYHMVRAGLLGDAKQSGDGAWTLYLFDVQGNQVWAHIQLRTPDCSLHYYPHDYSKRGGGREVDFRRDGMKIIGPISERKSP